MLNLLLEMQEANKSNTTKLQDKADQLRLAGNKAFRKGKYEKASRLYTQSIEVVEDHPSYNNRAFTTIKLGQKMLNDEKIVDSIPTPMKSKG